MESKRVFTAIILSFLVYFLWMRLYGPDLEDQQKKKEEEKIVVKKNPLRNFS